MRGTTLADATDARTDPITVVASASEVEMLEALLNNDHPVKSEVAQWARDHLADDTLPTRDHECIFWREGWEQIAARGLLGMLATAEHGGQGRSLTTTLLALEGLGLGCRDDGLVFATTSQVLTVGLALERFGTSEQAAHWMPRLISGESIGSFAMSEEQSGSDAFALQTVSEPVDGGYVLNGEKAWVTMAPAADVFIVFASTNPELGRWGINAFCIPADTPGLLVGPNRPKMGMRTTPFANVRFTDCFVPTTARMGAEGAGASIFTSSMEAERGFLLVGSIGALERLLDDSVEFARTREQFGEAIGSFQGVSHQLSEVKMAHESARLLMYKAAALHERGTSSMMAAALSKLAGSEAALEGALAAVEIHGARGYVTEFGVERDLRNLSGGVIYGGASGIQKNIIARLLGLPA